jgi:hypothetical protein
LEQLVTVLQLVWQILKAEPKLSDGRRPKFPVVLLGHVDRLIVFADQSGSLHMDGRSCYIFKKL